MPDPGKYDQDGGPWVAPSKEEHLSIMLPLPRRSTLNETNSMLPAMLDKNRNTLDVKSIRH